MGIFQDSEGQNESTDQSSIILELKCQKRAFLHKSSDIPSVLHQFIHSRERIDKGECLLNLCMYNIIYCNVTSTYNRCIYEARSEVEKNGHQRVHKAVLII